MQNTWNFGRFGFAAMIAFSPSCADGLAVLAQQLGNLPALTMSRLKLRQREKRAVHVARCGLAQPGMRLRVVDDRQQAAVRMTQGRRGFGQPAGTGLRVGEIEMAHHGSGQCIVGSRPLVEVREREYPRRLANGESPQQHAAEKHLFHHRRFPSLGKQRTTARQLHCLRTSVGPPLTEAAHDAGEQHQDERRPKATRYDFGISHGASL